MIEFATNLCLDEIQDNHIVGIHAASVTGNSATNGHALTPYNSVYMEMLTQLHATQRVMITNHPSVTIIMTSWDSSDAARGGAGQIVCVLAPCHSHCTYWNVYTGLFGNFYWFTTNNIRHFKEYKHFDVCERNLLNRHVDLFNFSTTQLSDDGYSSADTLKTQVGESSNSSEETDVMATENLFKDGKCDSFIDKLRMSILNAVDMHHPTMLVQKGNEVVFSMHVAEDEDTCMSICTHILLTLQSCLVDAYDHMSTEKGAPIYIDSTHVLFPDIGKHDVDSKQRYRLKLLQFGYFKKSARVDKGMCKKVVNVVKKEMLFDSIDIFVRRCMCDLYVVSVDKSHDDDDGHVKGTPWVMWRDLNASFVSAVNTILFTDTEDA